MNTEELTDKLRKPVLDCLHSEEDVKQLTVKWYADILVIEMECFSVSCGDLRRLGDLFDDDGIIVMPQGLHVVSLFVSPGPKSKIKEL